MQTAMIDPSDTGVTRVLARETPWSAVLAAYLDDCDSPRTRRAYARHIRDALTALEVLTLPDLTGAALLGYRKAVVTSAYAPATQALALAALRSFLSWSRDNGAHAIPADVVARTLRGPKATVQRPYNVLSDSELSALYAAAQTPRDRALLAVLTGAGLRVSEVVALDVSDVLEDNGGNAKLYVRLGKGAKDRQVPIQPDVTAAIRAYLAATGRFLGQPGPLFRAHDRAASKISRGRLTARAVGQLVERLAHDAAIQGKAVSPHVFRHCYALRALANGRDLMAVSRLLGHASIQTTQRYIDHLDQDRLRDVVPALPWSVAA